jgi:hypothetical protein
MPPEGLEVVDLHRRIVAAIRAVDTGHMLIVEGTDAARDFSMFDAPLDDDEIYSFHMYTWFGDDRRGRLADYARVATAQGIPMWCGEFGENTRPTLESTLDLFDAQKPAPAGWSFWTRPTPQEARSSMDAFLDASAFSKLTSDAGLVQALSAHARR